MSKFYITTTLPYVNASPHLGFALEIVRADVLARWHRFSGDEVFFNTGADEHGLKIYRQAQAASLEPQVYCDQMASKFMNLKTALALSYDNFIRTTDLQHVEAAQEFWRRAEAAGDIYKKTYQTKYCVGCELEKTDSELVDGRCPNHPQQELELIDEENYFFRFSKYQERLLKLYDSRPDFVWPPERLKEIKNFVQAGLTDFSVSRLASKLPWGVTVPGDPGQVMYVWFDALINYISALGWPRAGKFKDFWPGYQIAGKDNLRQQAAMWPAMLLSVGLEPEKQVLINGFITSDGQKMSKSLGNVVDPLALAQEYGSDALRYYLLAYTNVGADTDFTVAAFRRVYQADLANGLGNLTARVAALLEKNNLRLDLANVLADEGLVSEVAQALTNYDFAGAMNRLWLVFRRADETISAAKPWAETDAAKVKAILEPLVRDLVSAAQILKCFLPATADKILAQYQAVEIKKAAPLWPRLEMTQK